jgi:hypothetical protein
MGAMGHEEMRVSRQRFAAPLNAFHGLPVGMGTVPMNSVRYSVIMVMFYHGTCEIFLPQNKLVVNF